MVQVQYLLTVTLRFINNVICNLMLYVPFKYRKCTIKIQKWEYFQMCDGYKIVECMNNMKYIKYLSECTLIWTIAI